MDDEKEEQVLRKSRHPVVFVNHVDTYVGKSISKVNLKNVILILPLFCDK
jgi:hypothetical protein